MAAKRKPVIYLATDHAGLALKDAVKSFLIGLKYHVHDVGTFDDTACDYPDFIIPASEAVARSKGGAVGIIFGGTGIGEAISANKVRGVRAAVVDNAFTARKSREHNDANVLSIGSRTVTKNVRLTKRLVKIWLTTPFSGASRHVRRLKKIAAYEKR